jgi:hypothetical protein
MIGRRFEPAKDLEAMQEWFSDRGLNAKWLEELPPVGFVAVHEGFPICAGFLRRCEGGMGMIDSYVTDPKASPELRDKALEVVTNQIITFAKESGLRRLIAYSVDKNTLLRAERWGFKLVPQSLIARDLNS